MNNKLLLFVGLWLFSSVSARAVTNNALNFDGNDDFVELTALAKDAPDFSKGFSFAGWVKCDQFKGNARFIDLASGPEFANNIIFRIDNASGVLSLQSIIGTTSSNNTELKTADVLPSGTWGHVAATIDSQGNAKIYFNGVLQKSGHVNAPVNIERTCCYLGKSAWANDSYFSGCMDEVSIWNRVLTQEEIASYRKTELTGNETGLTAYYKFNEGTASGTNGEFTTLTDATTPANNGTLKAFALTGNQSNFVAGVDLNNIPHYLDVSPAIMNFTCAKSVKATCMVKCDTNWERKNGCDWVSFESTEGKPDSITCTTLSVNNTGARRMAKIAFAVPGTTITDTMVIYQDIESIKLASKKKSCGKSALSHTVAVTSAVDWKANTDSPTWLTPIIDPVDGNLSFFVSENNTNAYRTGKIFLKSSFAADTLDVTQFTFDGEGSDVKPFLIGNYADLKCVASDLKATYRLVSDIDASASKTENGGAGFSPIGSDETNSFNGMFHGAGHKITGLCINRPTADYVGLFGTKYSGTIDSLSLADCTITGKSYVGALVGRTYDYSQIKNCSSTGKVTGTGTSNIGGLIGQSYHNVTVSNCHSDCLVSSTGSCFNVGGLVGFNEYDSSISDSYATGNIAITTECTYNGGLVGKNFNNCTVTGCYASGNVNVKGPYTGGLAGINFGTITNSYALGKVAGTSYVGGLLGYNSATVSNSYSIGKVAGSSKTGGLIGFLETPDKVATKSYYNTQTSGCTDNDGRGVPLSSKLMMNSSTFSGWDFSTVWNQTTDKTYPALRSVNNAPVAFSDSLISHMEFDLSKLLLNDYDFETGTSRLVCSIKSKSAGTVSGNKLTFPQTVNQGDVLTLAYRLGEVVAEKDTLWGMESDAKIQYERAKTNNSLSFDGGDDYVLVSALSKDAPDFSQGFTFAGWIKWEKFNGNSRLIDFASGAEYGNNIIFRLDDSKGILSLQSIIGTTGANNTELKTPEVLPLGTWCHVAATIDKTGNASIYVNGCQEAKGTINVPANVTRSNCYLGKSAWGQDPYFKGSMDEVSLWNKALSQSEIVNVRKSRLAGNETGLAVYFPFNQGIAAGANDGQKTLQDTTSYLRNGSLINFALTGSSSNFVEGMNVSKMPHYLIASPSSIGLACTVSSRSYVKVKSDTLWTCKNNYDWLSFQSSKENPDSVICTTTKVNDTGVKRMAIVPFSVPGTMVADTVIVYQDIASIALSVKVKTAGKNAQSQSVTVNTPMKWIATDSADWITVPVDSVATGGTLTFSVKDNTTGSIRTAKIYVKSKAAADTLTVNQLTLIGEGSSASPYLIGNYADLRNISSCNELTSTYRITADIDASASRTENGGAGFIPIGTDLNNTFSGSIRGGGHAISGLYINRPTTDYVGLIGVKSGGVVDSLTLSNCDITGKSYLGALAGRFSAQASVNNCVSTGKVTGVGSLNVGGLVGQSYHGVTISKCRSKCQIIASNVNVGGILGLNEDASILTDSYFTGIITGSSNYIGGLVGNNMTTSNLVKSFTSGKITGKGLFTGGVAGLNDGTVADCYSASVVKGETYVGGLVGYNVAELSNSYNVGAITGTSDVNGCVGLNGSKSVLTNCFYNSQSTGCKDNAGRGKPLNCKQMVSASNFTGWDLSLTWEVLEGKTFPALRNLNNTPTALADSLISSYSFGLNKLISNDYDHETGNSRLVYTVKSVSAGSIAGDSLLLPKTFVHGDLLTITYQIGEIVSDKDTLWGNEITSKVVYNKPIANNALAFDGIDDYVQLTSLEKDAPDLSNGFSFAGWVKSDQFKGNARFIDLASGPEFSNNIIFRIDNASGVLSLESVNGTTSSGDLSFKTKDLLPLNTWCHLAATIDATGNASIYFNGVLQTSGKLTAPVNVSRSNCYLGKSAWASDSYFSGCMDEVSLWSKALTTAEIQTISKSRLKGNENGLMAYYTFNQGLSSGKNNSITLQDTTSFGRSGDLVNFTLDGTKSNFVDGVDVSTVHHYLNVSPSPMTFTSGKGLQATCTVKSDASWLRMNGCDWLDFTSETATPENITCTTSKVNDTGVRRKAEIVFSVVGSDISDTLTIYQEVETIKLTNKKKSCGKNAQSQTTPVTSSVKWKASTGTAWITVSADSTAAGENLTFSVAENTTNAVRSGTIFLKSRFAADTLTVLQFTFEGEGSETRPFLIGTYTDLKYVGNDLKSSYRLIADIDASASRNENSGAGFEPIGTDESNSFNGMFRGGGHIIKGLYINRPNTDYVALFGTKYGNTVDSLALVDCDITGRNYVGAFIGRTYDYSRINNCYATGKVAGSGALNIGGLVGQSYHGVIVSGCHSACQVRGDGINVGGLVGLNEFESTVSGCYVTGNVSSASGYVGGLIGDNRSGCILSESYTTGNVSGKGAYTGGLTGMNGGVVTDCYVVGDMDGTTYVGGLTGYNASSLFNSYSLGKVTGTSNTSRCVGKSDKSATVSNCYFNLRNADEKTTVTDATALTLDQMKDSVNFAGWNSKIWSLVKGKTYPVLRAVNNAPTGYADVLVSNTTFNLSNLVMNDYDYENGSSKLTYSVKNISAGSLSGGSLLIPASCSKGDSITVVYRIGEIVSVNDTLWGNVVASKIVYDPTLVGIDPVSSTKVTVYPNPATEGFYVVAESEQAVMILSDLSGKQITTREVTGKIYVDICDLASGMYIVQVGGKRIKLIKK